jgi:hypothetical protein
MQAKPDAKEHRGYLTVNVPLSVMERLEPFALRRIKSKFVTAAITAALDQYDAEQAAQEPEPAEAAS